MHGGVRVESEVVVGTAPHTPVWGCGRMQSCPPSVTQAKAGQGGGEIRKHDFVRGDDATRQKAFQARASAGDHDRDTAPSEEDACGGLQEKGAEALAPHPALSLGVTELGPTPMGLARVRESRRSASLVAKPSCGTRGAWTTRPR